MTDPFVYLRNRNPVVPNRLLSDEFRAPEGLAAEIMARAPRVGTAPMIRPRRHRLWRLAVPALAVAATVAVLIVTRGGTTEAGAAFDRLANAAMDERQTLQKGGRIRMTVVESAGITTVTGTGPEGAFFALGRQKVVRTIDADGRMESVTTSVAPTFLGPEDRRRWIASGRLELGSAGTRRQVSKKQPPTAPPSGITASPATVRARFDEYAREQSHWPQGVAAMVVAQDILLMPTLSAEVHVNVFRALSTVEGLSTSSGPVTRSGHPTTVVWVDSDYSGANSRYELIFDTTDGRLVGSRTLLLERQDWVDAAPPVVLESNEVTEFTLLPPAP